MNFFALNLILLQLIQIINCAEFDDNYAEVQFLLDEIRFFSAKKFGLPLDKIFYRPGRPVKIDDDTEAGFNSEIANNLFENDIILTKLQAESILDDVKNDGKIDKLKKHKKRQLISYQKYYWFSKIPYFLSFNNPTWKYKIRVALQNLELETCLRFQEINKTYHLDSLNFIKGSGCYSYVGKIGGQQKISIDWPCQSLGIIQHETLHALGLWHEQSRYDRDQFISINFDNIYPGMEYNFDKRTSKNTNNINLPYDYGSVMHYGSKSFIADYRKNSILTNDPIYQQTIGQRQKPSFKDLKLINSFYCDENCVNKLDCKNGGYTNPNDCNKCKCPDGFAGKYCQDLALNKLELCKGGIYNASNDIQYIQSFSSQPGLLCYYKITAEKNNKININLKKINFACNFVCKSFIEIKFKKDKVTTGARICCSHSKKIISEDSEVIIILYLEDDIKNKNYGFKLTYKLESQNKTYSTKFYPAISNTETTIIKTTTAKIITYWTDWSEWSSCSKPCGGCGLRKRIRSCYYNNNINCKNTTEEVEECNKKICSINTNTFRCKGRLLMPCELLKKLDFGTIVNNDFTKSFYTKNFNDNRFLNSSQKTFPTLINKTDINLSHLLNTEKNHFILKTTQKELKEKRIKRFVDGNKQLDSKFYCEKRFTFNCITNNLTISMDWKTSKITKTFDERLCCPGYYANEFNICNKKTS